MIPERYSRQVLVSGIGEEGQRRIMEARVVIIGLGALGSNIANILARAGVGKITLVDRDFVDWSNLQRQGLYDESDARDSLPKAVAAREHLMRINSEISYQALVEDVNSGNVEQIIEGATVVVDGLDNFQTRALINEACVKHDIPWIYGSCISTYGNIATFVPGRTACFNCLMPDVTSHAHSPFTCDTVGVLGPVAFMIAALEAAEAIKIMTGNLDQISQGLTFVDIWQNSTDRIALQRSDDCQVCGHHQYPLLSEERTLMTTTLCGRNAVQVIPPNNFKIDFDALKASLAKIFPMTENRYLVKFRCGDYEVALFREGRAIIFGTTDTALARNIYGRYIGG